MSDTPRTDAEANGGNSMGVLIGNGLRYALVQSEFARQLERELNAANERIKRLEEAGDEMFKWSERVGQEYWMKAKDTNP